MLEVVKADLNKRLSRIPEWYFDSKPDTKAYILDAIETNNLVAAEDSIYFIEYKLEKWAA